MSDEIEQGSERKVGWKEQRDALMKRRAHQERLRNAPPSVKTDAELIAEAVAAGKVRRVEDGKAEGALVWPVTGNSGRRP